MATPSLFPIFMKAQGGGSTPAGVVGGFIEGTVVQSLRAVASASPVNASVAAGPIRASVVASFTGRVLKPVTAVVQPSPITGKINDA